MYEGKNIHYSPSDNKRLCSYSVKLCKQRRLNGYSLCLRHVLEDPEAPYRRCLYMAKNKQQCTNPIHKQSDAQFCTSHMQLMGVTPASGVTSIQNSVTPSSKPTPNINSANLNSTVGVNISDCINKTCNNESGIQNNSPIKATVVGANNIKTITDDNPNESTVKLLWKSNVVNSSSMLQLDRNSNVSHCNLVLPVHLMGSYVMNSNRELVSVPSMGLSLATVGSKEAKLGDVLHTGTTMPSICRDNSLLMTDIAGCKSPISNQVLGTFSGASQEVKFSNVQISQQPGFSSPEIRFSQISHQPGFSANNITRTEPISDYKSTENILTNCASCNTSTLTPSQSISFVGIRGLSSSPAGHTVISQVGGLNSLLALRSPLLLGDSNHLLKKPPDVSINSANPNISSSIGLSINQKPQEFLSRAQFPMAMSNTEEKIVSVPIFQSGGVVSNVPILLSQVRPACLSPRPPSANPVIGMQNSATSTMPTILTWPFPVVATNLRPVVTPQGTGPSGGQDLTNMKMSLSQILNKLLGSTVPGAAVSNSSTLPASTSSLLNSQRIASENNASKMIPTQNFSMSNTSHGNSDLLSTDSLLKSVTTSAQIINKAAECVIVNTSDSALLEKDNMMVPGTLSTSIIQAASSNVPSLSASQTASIAWPCMLGSRVVSSALYSPNKPIPSSSTALSTAMPSMDTTLSTVISSPLSSAALVTVPAITSSSLLSSGTTLSSLLSTTTTSSISLASSTITTSTRSYQLPISHSTFKSLSPSAALANSWQTQFLSALMASVTSLSSAVTTASDPVSSAVSETTGSVSVQTGLSKPVLSSIQTGDGGINSSGELEVSQIVSSKDVVKSKKKSQKRNSQKSKSDSLVSELKTDECIKPDIIITPPVKETLKRSYVGKKSSTLLGFSGLFKNENHTDEERKSVPQPPAKRWRVSDGAKTEKASKRAGVSHSANSLGVPTPELGLSATSAPRYMHSIGGYSKKCCVVQSRGSDLSPRERGLLERCRGPMRDLVEGWVREKREGRCLVPTGVDSSDDEGGGDSDYQLPWQRARCCLSSDESDLSDNGDLDEDTDASNRLGELHKIKCRLQRSFLIGQSCSHDNRLLWRRELKRTALLVAVLRYGRDREAAAVLEGLMRGGRGAERCGVRGTRGSDKISGRRGCLYKDDDDILCSGVALPYTNHCIRHITYNVDQQLFDYCSVKDQDGTQCSAPVFNSTYAQPICIKHAQEMESQKLTTDGDLDIKPKKVRKKTKPSALTRPPRKGKKKRLQRKLASVLQDIKDEEASGVDSNNDIQKLLDSCDQTADSYSQQLSSYSPQKHSSVLQLSSFSQQKGCNVQQLSSYLQQKDSNIQQLSSYSEQKQSSLQQGVDEVDTGAPRGVSRVSDLFEGGDYTSLFLNEGLCKDTLALNEGEDLEEPFSPDTIARQLDTLEEDHGSGLFDVTSDLQFVFSRLHDVESFDLLSEDDLAQMPQWKSYLYMLQQQAPKPKRIDCNKEMTDRPPQYGKEYHGTITRDVTDFHLTLGGEGSYLIRASQRAPGEYTLAIRFEGVTKNYKLYYDGQHYVGEKRFDTIHDLVADGLIIFYLESKAADYIASLPTQSNYAESPYAIYSTHVGARQNPQRTIPKSPGQVTPRRPPRMGTSQLGCGHHPHRSDGEPNGVRTGSVSGSVGQVSGSAGQVTGSRSSGKISGSRSSGSIRSTRREAEGEQAARLGSISESRVQQIAESRQSGVGPLVERRQKVSRGGSDEFEEGENGRPVPPSEREINGSNGAVLPRHASDASDGPWRKRDSNSSPAPLRQNVRDSVIGRNPSTRSTNSSSSSVLLCSDFMEVMGSEKLTTLSCTHLKDPHWCDFCANFLWGLIAQGVKCQDCGFNAHKKCSEKVPADCMPAMKYVKRMFGVDLTTLVKAQSINSLIPPVVELCVNEIEKRGGLESEGLYRITGYHDDMEAIRIAFDKERQELKGEKRVESLRYLLSFLPPAHFHTLKYFTSHLNRLVERHDKNLMSAENLAIIFAPTLLRSPETDPALSLSAQCYELELIQLFIVHQGDLFDAPPTPLTPSPSSFTPLSPSLASLPGLSSITLTST